MARAAKRASLLDEDAKAFEYLEGYRRSILNICLSGYLLTQMSDGRWEIQNADETDVTPLGDDESEAENMCLRTLPGGATFSYDASRKAWTLRGLDGVVENSGDLGLRLIQHG